MSAPSDLLTDIHLSFTYWRPTAVFFARGEAFHREPLVYDYTSNFPLLMFQRMAVYQAARSPACTRVRPPVSLLKVEGAFCHVQLCDQRGGADVWSMFE